VDFPPLFCLKRRRLPAKGAFIIMHEKEPALKITVAIVVATNFKMTDAFPKYLPSINGKFTIA
jgi:hypothetical protein